MKDFFFWSRWSKTNRLLYLSILSLAAVSILFYAVSGLRGLGNVIEWSTQKNLSPFSLKIDEFTKGPISYKVEVETYLINETFKASEIKINQSPAILHLLLVFSSLCLLLTILSFLKRSWYIIGMAAFILFIVLLKLELLTVFNFGQEFTIVVLILVCGLSYYFHAFNENVPFIPRLLSFAGCFAAIAMAISFGSKIEAPFLYLANFGVVGPIVLSLLFIIIIGYEVVGAFLFISTAGKNLEKKNRLLNFTIITFLYFANLILLLLKKKNYIEWDILYLNMFLLLFISFLIGIWGYKKRSITFRDTLPFSPYGALFYLSLAILTFSTIAYSFATGNDPLTECFEYSILYSHLCLGFIFFCYVGFNFMHLFNKNLSIYEVVYQPMRMPLFMVRGVGCAAILALFLYSNSFPFYLGLAGYYNGCGDVYTYNNDLLMAKQYYRSGVQFEFQNHRSNYSLASLADLENNKEVAQEYYTATLFKNPSEYSVVNLSNFYL
ncbi:MAG TPA: hypothetical protein VF691_19060, partial [Cytophagaceae bacterium]